MQAPVNNAAATGREDAAMSEQLHSAQETLSSLQEQSRLLVSAACSGYFPGTINMDNLLPGFDDQSTWMTLRLHSLEMGIATWISSRLASDSQTLAAFHSTVTYLAESCGTTESLQDYASQAHQARLRAVSILGRGEGSTMPTLENEVMSLKQQLGKSVSDLCAIKAKALECSRRNLLGRCKHRFRYVVPYPRITPEDLQLEFAAVCSAADQHMHRLAAKVEELQGTHARCREEFMRLDNTVRGWYRAVVHHMVEQTQRQPSQYPPPSAGQCAPPASGRFSVAAPMPPATAVASNPCNAPGPCASAPSMSHPAPSLAPSSHAPSLGPLRSRPAESSPEQPAPSMPTAEPSGLISNATTLSSPFSSSRLQQALPRLSSSIPCLTPRSRSTSPPPLPHTLRLTRPFGLPQPGPAHNPFSGRASFLRATSGTQTASASVPSLSKPTQTVPLRTPSASLGTQTSTASADSQAAAAAGPSPASSLQRFPRFAGDLAGDVWADEQMMAWLRGLLGKSIQYERVMMNASTKRRMPGLLRRLADELDAEGTAGAVQADPTPSKPTTASVSAQVPAADGFISSAAAPSSTVLVEDFRALKEHVSQLDARLTTVEAAQPVQEKSSQAQEHLDAAKRSRGTQTSQPLPNFGPYRVIMSPPSLSAPFTLPASTQTARTTALYSIGMQTMPCALSASSQTPFPGSISSLPPRPLPSAATQTPLVEHSDWGTQVPVVTQCGVMTLRPPAVTTQEVMTHPVSTADQGVMTGMCQRADKGTSPVLSQPGSAPPLARQSATRLRGDPFPPSETNLWMRAFGAEPVTQGPVMSEPSSACPSPRYEPLASSARFGEASFMSAVTSTASTIPWEAEAYQHLPSDMSTADDSALSDDDSAAFIPGSSHATRAPASMDIGASSLLAEDDKGEVEHSGQGGAVKVHAAAARTAPSSHSPFIIPSSICLPWMPPPKIWGFSGEAPPITGTESMLDSYTTACEEAPRNSSRSLVDLAGSDMSISQPISIPPPPGSDTMLPDPFSCPLSGPPPNLPPINIPIISLTPSTSPADTEEVLLFQASRAMSQHSAPVTRGLMSQQPSHMTTHRSAPLDSLSELSVVPATSPFQGMRVRNAFAEHLHRDGAWWHADGPQHPSPAPPAAFPLGLPVHESSGSQAAAAGSSSVLGMLMGGQEAPSDVAAELAEELSHAKSSGALSDYSLVSKVFSGGEGAGEEPMSPVSVSSAHDSGNAAAFMATAADGDILQGSSSLAHTTHSLASQGDASALSGSELMHSYLSHIAASPQHPPPPTPDQPLSFKEPSAAVAALVEAMRRDAEGTGQARQDAARKQAAEGAEAEELVAQGADDLARYLQEDGRAPFDRLVVSAAMPAPVPFFTSAPLVPVSSPLELVPSHGAESTTMSPASYAGSDGSWEDVPDAQHWGLE